MIHSTDLQLAEVVARAGKVGVLMGGSNAEREVSLNSGRAVTAGLKAAGVDAVAVDWDGSLQGISERSEFDRFFIALHGRGGEDGQVQAVLDLLNKPYTGSRAAACALAMDKARTKWTWLGAGLPTPPFMPVDAGTVASDLIAKLGLPLFIKPAREGSSVGISKVRAADELAAAVASAAGHDSLIIAEKCIVGGEYTSSVLADRTLPMIKLETPREFYDYQAKYLSDDTVYQCPCGLDPDSEREASEIALKAFHLLDGHGWGRVDFMCDEAGAMWLIELNTVPGMTDHSLVPMAAAAAGMTFEDLVLTILASSMTWETRS